MVHPEEIDDRIDLQSAALELGVHYQTAYRWVRNGRLQAELIDGRYLVTRDDVAAAANERSVPQRPAPPGDARVKRQADTILQTLLDGDETGARAASQKLASDGLDVIDLIEQVIAPALREIGRAWHAGEIDIWVEHRASAIVERILGDIVPNPRGRRRGVAVIAAVEGDRHGLPTTMATVALRSANWTVHQLGADTPADTLCSFLGSNQVDLVVLSSTNSQVADVLERTAAAVRELGLPVLTGEPGATLRDLVDAAADCAVARRSA